MHKYFFTKPKDNSVSQIYGADLAFDSLYLTCWLLFWLLLLIGQSNYLYVPEIHKTDVLHSVLFPPDCNVFMAKNRNFFYPTILTKGSEICLLIIRLSSFLSLYGLNDSVV